MNANDVAAKFHSDKARWDASLERGDITQERHDTHMAWLEIWSTRMGHDPNQGAIAAQAPTQGAVAPKLPASMQGAADKAKALGLMVTRQTAHKAPRYYRIIAGSQCLAQGLNSGEIAAWLDGYAACGVRRSADITDPIDRMG